MKNHVRIQGVHVDLDAIKAENPTKESLVKDDKYFSHLSEAEKAAAYEALSKELDAYTPKPATVIVEKGSKTKTVKAEPAETAKAKEEGNG